MNKGRIICAALLLLALAACNTTQTAAPEPQLAVSLEKSAAELKATGRRNFGIGQYENAAKAYYAASLKDPADSEIRLGLAESYYKLGKGAAALEEFRKLLDAPGYEARALQGSGLSRLMTGDGGAAETDLRQAVNEDDTLWRAWNGLAQIYDSRKDWEAADSAYQSALVHTDRPEVLYNNMGISYMAQENFEKAADSFHQALGHKPDLAIASTNYKLALAMLDRYDEATIEHNERDEAKALNNAGYAAMLRGDYAEAERMFVRAIESNPSFYKSAYNNLQVLYHLKAKKQ